MLQNVKVLTEYFGELKCGDQGGTTENTKILNDNYSRVKLRISQFRQRIFNGEHKQKTRANTE